MARITELYVGLSDKSMENRETTAEDVIATIKELVVAGTFKEGKGLWKGQLESSLVFEVADLEDNLTEQFEEAYEDELADSSAVEVLKELLETEFNQDSVMVKRYEADIMF